MKIGVLADTHVPDIFLSLPPHVLEVLSAVDIILHAGDVCDLSVLQQLEAIAQTFAVFGERDGPEVKRYLQEKQRLEFAGRAVGLVHGHHAWEGSLLTRVLYTLDRARQSEVLHESVLREFTNVDAIVFGHSHEPYMKMHGSILLFNPGSIAPRRGQRGSVGILEIGARAIKGRIIPL
jgi:putative phosphoesterase